MTDQSEPRMVDRLTLDMINGPQLRLRLEDLEQVLADRTSERDELRAVLELAEEVLDGLMSGANNSRTVVDGITISDRWFAARDRLRRQLHQVLHERPES